MDQADVVVVGGGIAGASLAYALANAGKDVAVLEASVEFEDRCVASRCSVGGQGGS